MIIGLVSLKSKWELNSTSCEWVLVGNNEPEPEFDWFFIMEHFMKEQYHGILDLLFKGRSGTIYFIPHFTDGEEIYLFERYQFEEYKDDYNEYTCFSENVSWIYYKRHEGTVSFAGTILNEAKRILASEKQHWNQFQYQ